MADHVHIPHAELGIACALTCLQETAEVVAAKSDWGAMYDSTALGKNQVPVASATYYEVISSLLSLSQNTPSVACHCASCAAEASPENLSALTQQRLLCFCLLQHACIICRQACPLWCNVHPPQPICRLAQACVYTGLMEQSAALLFYRTCMWTLSLLRRQPARFRGSGNGSQMNTCILAYGMMAPESWNDCWALSEAVYP